MSFDSKLTLVLAFGEILVLSLLIWRRIWRTLPVFSLYMLWSLVSDLAGFYFQRSTNPHEYFTFFAVQSAIDSGLMFAVFVELGWSVLKPVRASLPRGAIIVLAVLIALAGALIWPLAGLSLPQDVLPRAVTFMHLNQTVVILRVVCFLVMAAFSQLLSIGWRDRELQIATGLGFYSMISLLVTLLDSHQSSLLKIHMYHLAVSFSYLGTLSYWVLSFATKEYQRKEFSPQMQQLLVYMGGAARAGSIALTDLPSERLRKKD